MAHSCWPTAAATLPIHGKLQEVADLWKNPFSCLVTNCYIFSLADLILMHTNRHMHLDTARLLQGKWQLSLTILDLNIFEERLIKKQKTSLAVYLSLPFFDRFFQMLLYPITLCHCKQSFQIRNVFLHGSLLVHSSNCQTWKIEYWSIF